MRSVDVLEYLALRPVSNSLFPRYGSVLTWSFHVLWCDKLIDIDLFAVKSNTLNRLFHPYAVWVP